MFALKRLAGVSSRTVRHSPIAINRLPYTALSNSFFTSSVSWKKASKKSGSKKGGKIDLQEEEEIIEEDPAIVLKTLEDNNTETLKLFKDKLNETKLGHANPKIFDNLEVSLSHKETTNFLSVAQTSLKGRNLIITVFDPNYAKNVISAVLGAGLNLNPEAVPNSTQQLKVSLPPPTTETRKEIAKTLKTNFDNFKNSANYSHSLSYNRAIALKDLKQYKKSDAIKKVTNDVEKLHKKYINELQEVFKSAEKAVLS